MNRYKTVRRITSDENTRYISNPIYPDVPLDENDTYLIATDGDRYDILANAFYGDETLWWIIAAANSSNRDSMFITPGKQLRIPANSSLVVERFRELNRVR